MMRKLLAVLVAAGLLGLVLGCQPPGGSMDKMNELEKTNAELKAHLEKLTEAVDKLSKDLGELAASYAEHVEKHHKGTAYTPPAKKPVAKVK
jgi:hypothetical protein